MHSLPFLFISLLLLSVARAEDWTTTDGKTHQNVKIIKIEADAVTVLDSSGSERIPFTLLPPEVQKEFNYEPAKPMAAADTDSAATAPAPPAPAAGSQFALNPGESSASAAAHQHVNPDWKLVWSDEFNGDSIDRSKWSFEINGNGGGNGEMEYYTDAPENAHIENGKLLITAIKDGVDSSGQSHAFTSARMTTKNKFSWRYGRFEARIKMPKGRGVWPAFWLMPEDEVYGGWARSGEIDIVEEVGDQSNTAYGTIHYGDNWPNNVHTGDKFILPSGDLGDDFHVYAVEWEEGVIRWYIDGRLYQTQTKWYTNAAPFPAPFNQKFFIILNFAVGGAWPGAPSPDTVFPQSMAVDYVRVYQPADLK